MNRTGLAIVLGSGFSASGGLPLIRNLFDTTDLPRWQTDSARNNHEQVLSAYNRWKAANSGRDAEEWLKELYIDRSNPLQEMLHGTTWSRTIRFALSRLVPLPPGTNSHYYHGICTFSNCAIHERFWQKIEKEFSIQCIVTTNYDILVEQAMHSSISKHRSAPRCYYGGFQHTQVVRVMTDVTKKAHELVRLSNEIVLYKLHGSVNWAWEPHSPTLKIHNDVRAVFRYSDDFGVPAIIPPIPEKEMPPEFAQVWNEARRNLKGCSTWLICGYSLPEYDLALKEFFREILSDRKRLTLLLLDPMSSQLIIKWRDICHPNTKLIPMPGLPEALEYDWASAARETN